MWDYKSFTKAMDCMVAECSVYYWRYIGKYVADNRSNNVGMSNIN